MNEKLVKILEAARNNPKVKEKFLETRNAEDQWRNFARLPQIWVMK